jgi:hypothetical protein
MKTMPLTRHDELPVMLFADLRTGSTFYVSCIVSLAETQIAAASFGLVLHEQAPVRPQP